MPKKGEIDPDRVPIISTELVLEAVGLEVFRDTHGWANCRERGVGARRKKLGAAPAKTLFMAPPGSPAAERIDPIAAMEMARDGARVLLAEMCRVCPFSQCKMKVWGITAPSSRGAGTNAI